MISRKILIIILFLTALIFLSGCGQPVAPDEPVKPDDNQAGLPAELEIWIENSLDIFLGQAFEHEGSLYLLVTYGEKPTGGYTVEITDIAKQEGKLVVTVHFIEPADDAMVTQALTYPYDLAVVETVSLPVEFIATGAESYIPALYGVEYLLPIAAGSQWIKIFTPAPGESVARQFTVEGVANVFEGTVLYRLAGADKKVLDEGFTTGAMGDWGYFSFDLAVGEDLDSGTALLLELYTQSPKDGTLQDLVRIDLVLEN